MAGLRDKKKQKTRKAILDAASALFAEHGVEGTTIERIADKAETAVGTVYNYFGSKSELLLAIFSRETDAMLAAVEPIVAHSTEVEPLDALQSVALRYVDVLASIDPRLFKEVIRIGFSQSGPQTERLMELDYLLIGQLAELLSAFQAQGLVSDGATAQEQAFTLYMAVFSQLLVSLFTDEPDLETMRASVRRQTEIVFHGLKPP